MEMLMMEKDKGGVGEINILERKKTEKQLLKIDPINRISRNNTFQINCT